VKGRLAGKVALITGAGSGMGREACAVFASEGARVAAVDIDPELLVGTEAAVRATDGDIASFVADVGVEDQVRDAVEGAVERLGALHVLYNNAGVLWRDRDVSVLETDEEVWDRVFAINLKGVVWVCKYGIPHLIAGGGGAIVNVGSTSALLGAIRAARDPGELHPSGVHRHSDADGADHGSRMGRGRDRRDPAGPARDRTGHRERGAVPRERRGRVRDGHGARRGRRRGRGLSHLRGSGPTPVPAILRPWPGNTSSSVLPA